MTYMDFTMLNILVKNAFHFMGEAIIHCILKHDTCNLPDIGVQCNLDIDKISPSGRAVHGNYTIRLDDFIADWIR